jgi:hypothetical protein
MPRTPTTLQAQAEQHANEAHSRRLAELRELAPLLARLDELVPALAERRLNVYPENLSLQRLRTGDLLGPRHKVLRITGAFSLYRSERPAWYEAFRALGFRVVKHDAASTTYPTAVLRKGPLLVCVDLTRSEAEQLLASTPASGERESRPVAEAA